MQRERVASDVYVFTSDQYAQVTAGLIVTDDGAILIDTMAYPEETLQIKQFAEKRRKVKICYVINTHFHADHTTGTYLFPGVQVIAHARCRELLDTRGRQSLEAVRSASRELRDVQIVLPNVVFERGGLNLHIGGKTLQLWAVPGHSPDSIVCYLPEDRILFAADALMPLPYFVDGCYEDLLSSLEDLRGQSYESVVQGHGEVILPGEYEEKIQSDIAYLHALGEAVDVALASDLPDEAVAAIDIEACGKSRVLLNGVAGHLHCQNALALAGRRRELMQM